MGFFSDIIGELVAGPVTVRDVDKALDEHDKNARDSKANGAKARDEIAKHNKEVKDARG